ncbi:MAG: hypothetical protein A3F46_06830 [Legionellales bacterium RIFCSPHIGHO2_12_FULL_42_9]|nr:MAG: hypothetical protein A3F46_06830 [Legionellales bacterium RIFCSPHIGHO2_12_FULL_42_9]
MTLLYSMNEYKDRTQAGILLAEQLKEYENLPKVGFYGRVFFVRCHLAPKRVSYKLVNVTAS